MLHETVLVLWRKFAEFDRQRSFSSWAGGIAFNEVRRYRRKRRDMLLPLNDALMEVLIEQREQAAADLRIGTVRP